MIANAPTAPVEYVGTHAGEDDEFNPRLSAEARLDTASRLLGLDEGLEKVLRYPAREMTVHIPVRGPSQKRVATSLARRTLVMRWSHHF